MHAWVGPVTTPPWSVLTNQGVHARLTATPSIHGCVPEYTLSSGVGLPPIDGCMQYLRNMGSVQHLSAMPFQQLITYVLVCEACLVLSTHSPSWQPSLLTSCLPCCGLQLQPWQTCRLWRGSSSGAASIRPRRSRPRPHESSCSSTRSTLP